MKIVTSREFRENQKNYLELAKRERVVIRQGNKQSFLILPINESEETDVYFSDPYIRSQIEQGMQDVKTGKITRVKTKEELNNLLNSL
jgi:hypothetical protein